MVQICIAALALLTLAVMSLRANSKFKQQQRLPMQWSLSGTVNWTAPRPLALAFTPCLAAAIIPSVVIATFVTKPRPGQEGFEIPVVLFMCLIFVAAHAFHLWLIDRTVRADGS